MPAAARSTGGGTQSRRQQQTAPAVASDSAGRCGPWTPSWATAGTGDVSSAAVEEGRSQPGSEDRM